MAVRSEDSDSGWIRHFLPAANAGKHYDRFQSDHQLRPHAGWDSAFGGLDRPLFARTAVSEWTAAGSRVVSGPTYERRQRYQLRHTRRAAAAQLPILVRL